MHAPGDDATVSATTVRNRERKAFLLLVAVVFPLIAVLIVAGYGFMVWAYQRFAGPPTGA